MAELNTLEFEIKASGTADRGRTVRVASNVDGATDSADSSSLCTLGVALDRGR